MANPIWCVQNASDDFTRYQIEQVGWGRILRIEDSSDTPEENAALLAASPRFADALREIQIECELHRHGADGDRTPEIAAIAAGALALLARGG